MDFSVFLTTFGLIFVAELGDKTQLTAMTLAARFAWQKVFLGIACAFLVLNLAAVVVGQLLWTLVPILWIQLGTALLFLFFGICALRSKPDHEGESEQKDNVCQPVVTSFLMILMAELGDKTQLATAGLAAQHDAPVAVFAGSTLALWLVSLLGILVGKQLAQRLPVVYVHRSAGCLFILFAAVTLYRAWV